MHQRRRRHGPDDSQHSGNLNYGSGGFGSALHLYSTKLTRAEIKQWSAVIQPAGITPQQ